LALDGVPGHAKVSDLHHKAMPDEYVGGFEVPVEDWGQSTVEMEHSSGNGSCDGEELGWVESRGGGERPLVYEHVQRPTGTKLHDEVAMAAIVGKTPEVDYVIVPTGMEVHVYLGLAGGALDGHRRLVVPSGVDRALGTLSEHFPEGQSAEVDHLNVNGHGTC
jgi:hypothetical protein